KSKAEKAARDGAVDSSGAVDPAKDAEVSAENAAAQANGSTTAAAQPTDADGTAKSAAENEGEVKPADETLDPAADSEKATAAENPDEAAAAAEQAAADAATPPEEKDAATNPSEGEGGKRKNKKKRSWEMDSAAADGADDSAEEATDADENSEDPSNADDDEHSGDDETDGKSGKRKKKSKGDVGEGDEDSDDTDGEEGSAQTGKRKKRGAGEGGSSDPDDVPPDADSIAGDASNEERSERAATANDALDSPDLSDDQKREVIASLSRELLDELKRVESPEPELVDPALKRCREFVEDVLEKSLIPHPLRAIYREAKAFSDPTGHASTTQSFAILFAMLAGFIERGLLADLAIAAWLHDLGYSKLNPLLFGQARSALPANAIQELHGHLKSVSEVASRDGYELNRVILEIIDHHHENADGTGYPGKLKGPAVNELAQCLSLADAIDDHIYGRGDGTPASPAEGFRRLHSEKRRWSADLFRTIFIDQQASISSLTEAKVPEEQIRKGA
ncbi:MAG: HD domain-containing phosphohydrolase, partial [Bdellovibrionota bacterium]